MPRERTAKRIAQRIDIGYYRRLHPLRRWRLWLSLAAVGAALLWVGGLAALGREDAYSSGPVSRPHSVFGDACAACHIGQDGGFRRHVTDEACLACHDAPAHNPRQVSTPECASCHVEHRDAIRLAHVSDASCTACHGNLQVNAGELLVAKSVGPFNRRHPEFAAVKAGTDPGRLRFPHKAHLRDDLRAPDGSLAKLECGDCHRPPNVEAPWRFARQKPAGPAPAAARVTTATKPTADYGGRSMMAVRYEQNCAACHDLQFDARFAESAPHDKPEVVRAFLTERFREYIRRHPQELAQAPAPARLLPARAVAARAAARTPEQWVQQRVAEAEALLFQKSCKHCHEVEFGGASDSLAKVADPQVPARWFQRAIFDHQPHRMLDCDSCHNASESGQGKDLLIPGIANCQSCHRGTEAAEDRCFECHQYHPWGQQKHVKGRFRIEELTSGRPSARPQGD
jgi:predicted CXXCH cytochrome family protein